MTQNQHASTNAASTSETLEMNDHEPKYTKGELLAIFLGSLIVVPVSGALGAALAFFAIAYF